MEQTQRFKMWLKGKGNNVHRRRLNFSKSCPTITKGLEDFKTHRLSRRRVFFRMLKNEQVKILSELNYYKNNEDE